MVPLYVTMSGTIAMALASIECPGGGSPPPLDLPLLPDAFTANLQLNLQHEGAIGSHAPPGSSMSVYETVDSTNHKAMVRTLQEVEAVMPDNTTQQQVPPPPLTSLHLPAHDGDSDLEP